MRRPLTKTKEACLFVKDMLPFSLLAGLTGLIIYLACTPQNMHYLHWFAFVPTFYACCQESWKKNFYVGWCAGLVANGLVFVWLIPTVKDYGGVPYPLGAILLFLMAGWGAVLYGVLGAIFPWLRQKFPWGWLLLVPLFYSFLEYFFPNIFPYFQGCCQVFNLPILQIASVATISGVTFLTLLSSCVFYETLEAMRHKNWSKLSPLFIFVFVWGGLYFWGKARIERYDEAAKKAPSIRVGMPQTGWYIQELRYKTFEDVWNFYSSSTHKAIQKGADLVIWPESALRIPYRNAPLYKAAHEFIEKKFAQKKNVSLIYGGNYHEKESKGRLNSAFFVAPGGKKDCYHKIILVPFGEYLPFGDVYPISLLKGKIKGVQNVAPGKERKVFDVPYKTKTRKAKEQEKTFPVSAIICYEGIFHSKVRPYILDGAKLLVNLTADSWFKKTGAPHQHLMLAGLCSVQFGVGFLRSTDSGISAYFDPVGRMHQPSPLFVSHLWFREIPLHYEETIVTRYGFWFPYMCGILFGIVIAFSHLKRS